MTGRTPFAGACGIAERNPTKPPTSSRLGDSVKSAERFASLSRLAAPANPPPKNPMKILPALFVAALLVALPSSCKSTESQHLPCVCGTPEGDLEGCEHPL